MDELELKSLWQQQSRKLEETLTLNRKLIEEIQTQKAESKIRAFLRNQAVYVVLGILWVWFLGFLVYHTPNIFFRISIGAIVLFNIYAVAVYIKHIVILNSINIAESITVTQQKLTEVRISLSNVGRILILQTPFYCTFWYSTELFQKAGPQFWIINLCVVAIFCAASIYLYQKLTYKNMHIKWVKSMMESFGGKTLSKAVEFVDEIEKFKKG
ncbi:hypothetical protein C3K47_02900 [Solitalea longa]|uniref:Uncharacterized protein n=1 Tax=Solitalea longa TaxID=2079460 RepID=A0A2S5A7N8_9SPHI|nr:hypothetical protein [Solitalea longa]POY38362.1 hypothetical protein C3K47_02900 [Solitalea longa]